MSDSVDNRGSSGYINFVSLLALGLTGAALGSCNFLDDFDFGTGILRGDVGSGTCEVYDRDIADSIFGVALDVSRYSGIAAVVLGFLATVLICCCDERPSTCCTVAMLYLFAAVATLGMNALWVTDYCLNDICDFGWGCGACCAAAFLWLLAFVAILPLPNRRFLAFRGCMRYPEKGTCMVLFVQLVVLAACGASAATLMTCEFIEVDSASVLGSSWLGLVRYEPLGGSCQLYPSYIRTTITSYPFMEVSRTSGLATAVAGGIGFINIILVPSSFTVHRLFSFYHFFLFLICAALMGATNLVHLIGELCPDANGCKTGIGTYLAWASSGLWLVAAVVVLCLPSIGSEQEKSTHLMPDGYSHDEQDDNEEYNGRDDHFMDPTDYNGDDVVEPLPNADDEEKQMTTMAVSQPLSDREVIVEDKNTALDKNDKNYNDKNDDESYDDSYDSVEDADHDADRERLHPPTGNMEEPDSNYFIPPPYVEKEELETIVEDEVDENGKVVATTTTTWYTDGTKKVHRQVFRQEVTPQVTIREEVMPDGRKKITKITLSADGLQRKEEISFEKLANVDYGNDDKDEHGSDNEEEQDEVYDMDVNVVTPVAQAIPISPRSSGRPLTDDALLPLRQNPREQRSQNFNDEKNPPTAEATIVD